MTLKDGSSYTIDCTMPGFADVCLSVYVNRLNRQPAGGRKASTLRETQLFSKLLFTNGQLK